MIDIIKQYICCYKSIIIVMTIIINNEANKKSSALIEPSQAYATNTRMRAKGKLQKWKSWAPPWQNGNNCIKALHNSTRTGYFGELPANCNNSTITAQSHGYGISVRWTGVWLGGFCCGCMKWVRCTVGKIKKMT